MARRQQELATVIISISTMPDGANIERQWLRKSVWLSRQTIAWLMSVLLVFELIHRVLSGIARDILATYNHHKTNINHAPELITIYFISKIWGLTIWPAR